MKDLFTKKEKQMATQSQRIQKSVEKIEHNTQTDLSREEIVKKRRERRKLKREQKKHIQEQEKLKQKLNKKSEKVQIINLENFQKYQASTSSTTSILPLAVLSKKHKNVIQKDFNLFDFIVEKKEKKPLRRLQHTSKPLPIKINRGKKHEVPKKKCYTRLRRIILRNRDLKKQTNVETIETSQSKHESLEDKTAEEVVIDKFENLEIIEKQPNKKGIHSRRFQSYCDNTTSKELCGLTENLLRDLFRFQKRAYEKNQIKACAHRRYVVGFKEVKRQLEIFKVKLIIIAPDCEKCDLPGGISQTIDEIKAKCKDADIPYLFALNRMRIGYLLFKKVPVSCVGILSYDGAQDIFYAIVKCLENERTNYVNLMKNENHNSNT